MRMSSSYLTYASQPLSSPLFDLLLMLCVVDIKTFPNKKKSLQF